MSTFKALPIVFLVSACASFINVTGEPQPTPQPTQDAAPLLEATTGAEAGIDAGSMFDSGPPGPYCRPGLFDLCFDFTDADPFIGLSYVLPTRDNYVTFAREHFSREVSDFTSGPASLRIASKGAAYRDTLKFSYGNTPSKRIVLAFDMRMIQKNSANEIFAAIESYDGSAVYFRIRPGFVYLESNVVRNGVNVQGPRTSEIQVFDPSGWHHYEILVDQSSVPATMKIALDGSVLNDNSIPKPEGVNLFSDFTVGNPSVSFGRFACDYEEPNCAGDDVLLFDNVTGKKL